LASFAVLATMLSPAAAADAANAASANFIMPHNWEGARHARGKTGGRAVQRAAVKHRRHKAFRKHTSRRTAR
jgi:hypothetical protein